MRVVSFSLFGDNPLYCLGAVENARLCSVVYPGWKVIVFTHGSTDSTVLDALRHFGAELRFVDDGTTDPRQLVCASALWRFYAVDDTDAEAVIFRDADSRVSFKESAAVEEWLASGKDLHFMYDHEHHTARIMAGMWGVRSRAARVFGTKLRRFIATRAPLEKENRLLDQIFLHEVVWPEFVRSDNYIAHVGERARHSVPKEVAVRSPFPRSDGFLPSGTHPQSFVGETVLCPMWRNKEPRNRADVKVASEPVEPIMLVPPTRPGLRIRRLVVHSGYGDWTERVLPYSLTPFFQRHRDELSRQFPEGLQMWPLELQIESHKQDDFLLCFQPQHHTRALLDEAFERFKPRRSALVDYENSVTNPTRIWQHLPKYRGYFRYLFGSTSVLADGKKSFWIPNWNFLQDFISNHPVVPFIDDAEKRKRLLAVNPIQTGLHICGARIRIVDFFVRHGSDVALFGQSGLFERSPCLAWKHRYEGEIPFAPRPYRLLRKIDTFRNFRFTLVIENAFVDGYMTEKLAEPLAALSIPVYFGSPRIERYLPRLFDGGAINGHAFGSLKELLTYLESMSDDEVERRISVLRKFRQDYLTLTSHRNIWDFVLSTLFQFEPESGPSMHQLLNSFVALENAEPGMPSKRNEVLSEISAGHTPEVFKERIDRVLFQPAAMPWEELYPASKLRKPDAAAHSDSNEEGARAFLKAVESTHSESLSGKGSRLDHTEPVRTFLADIIRRFDIRSIVDGPCGDWNWMRHVSLDGINYTGLDIIPELVARNSTLYGSETVRFQTLDLIREIPPRGDLFICRDLLFHLSLRHQRAVIDNIRASGSTYILTTTFPWVEQNFEMSQAELDSKWGWRMINVELPPLDLGNPLEGVGEGPGCGSREQRLYRLDPINRG